MNSLALYLASGIGAASSPADTISRVHQLNFQIGPLVGNREPGQVTTMQAYTDAQKRAMLTPLSEQAQAVLPSAKALYATGDLTVEQEQSFERFFENAAAAKHLSGYVASQPVPPAMSAQPKTQSASSSSGLGWLVIGGLALWALSK